MGLKKLGKGLESLMSDKIGDFGTNSRSITEIDIESVNPNPDQPRKDIDEEKIIELSDSIRIHGILQPIIASKTEDPTKFEIIAGERRWRAAQQAGLSSVPVIVLDEVDTQKILELSLIENIQREDLNAIEKAKGYKVLLEKFSLTQEEVAQQVGQNRATVANHLRLLELPQDIQDNVSRGTLTMGHARAILPIQNNSQQRALVTRIIQDGLNVREVERQVQEIINSRGSGSPVQEEQKPLQTLPPYIIDLQEKLIRKLGCKTEIRLISNNRGKIIVNFASNEDFERILEHLQIQIES